MLKNKGLPAIFCLLLASFVLPSISVAINKGEKAPSFTLPDINGKQVNLDDFKGKLVLLYLWDFSEKIFWDYLPEIEVLHQRYKEKEGTVLCITPTPSYNTRQVASSKGITFPVLIDEKGNVINAYNPEKSYPARFLINKEGLVTSSSFGGDALDVALAKETLRLSSSISEAVDNIVDQIKERFATKEGKVSEIVQEMVYVNIGSSKGVAPGMEFEVVREGKEIKDPDSGEIIGHQETKIAEVKVDTAREKMSIARITEKVEGQSLNEGDKVVSKFDRKKVVITNLRGVKEKEDELSKVITEMLTTNMSQMGYLEVSRVQLEKAMPELASTDEIGPVEAKKIGETLSIDVVVSGNLSDLETAISLNIKMISAGSGMLIASAETKMVKTEEIVNKIEGVITGGIYTKSSSKTKPGLMNKAERILFNEDFSNYNEEDPLPEWGDTAIVKKSQQLKKNTITNTISIPSFFTQKVDFPENFSFEFDFYHSGNGNDFSLN
ncbi:MAG: peroxiredoxin family protein, partial [Candidatus Desantisbacteria bacterium]